MLQKWEKLGLIYCPDGHSEDLKTHAAVPFIGEFIANKIRIFFSARNKDNKSTIGALDFDLDKLSILKIEELPLFTPGKNGDFDYDGVMGCHISRINNKDYLFYIGWNLGVSVPFRNAIGIAKYEGRSFKRIFKGPVLDRSIYDPCFVASNCIFIIGDQYVMYYLSCIKWEQINNRLMHYYHIKIAISNDGFQWQPTGKVAIDFKYPNEYAISVPRVLFEEGIYKMWFSYRGGLLGDTYRIGYAESSDAFNWLRKDEDVELNVSAEGWDSEMICYPFVFNYAGNKYMLYNGNDYGKSGFGLAILKNNNL